MTLHSLQEEFVDAMRSYTATVNVISAQHSGKKQAMTATSVASLSLDPPSMLISVNKEASIHNILGKNRAFCINVLSPTQIDLAELCSNEEEEERFEKGNWGSYKDIPYNEDSVINIFCNCFDLFNQSTHSVFFGEVTKIIKSGDSVHLIYHDGKYIK